MYQSSPVLNSFARRGARNSSFWMPIAALYLGAVVCLPGFAATLKVAPARFIVHNVEPGREYDVYEATKMRLVIYNEDDVPHTWLLSTHRPSERGKLKTGYTEIPDAGWCWFEEDEVTVEPNSKGYGYLHVKIPPGAEYYNQRWICTLAVTGKPGPGGFGIALAVEITAQIETKSNAETDIRPHGATGTKPSIIRFENVSPGEVVKDGFLLCNGTKNDVTCELSPLFETPDITERVYLTHSYEPMSDSARLQYPHSVEVPAGGAVNVPIELTMPESTERNGNLGKLEELILIEPDRGDAVFVRIQATPTHEDNQVAQASRLQFSDIVQMAGGDACATSNRTRNEMR